MKDSGLFDAGLGTILPLDSIRRLDAALMKVKALNAGCMTGLGVQHALILPFPLLRQENL